MLSNAIISQNFISGYTSGFSISCMVFFTIVIVAKYFIGVEECPLFDDGVGHGEFELWNSTHEKYNESPNLLQENLLYYNASRLATHPVYVNGTEDVKGHISGACSTEWKLPEEYCNTKAEICESSAFITSEKVLIKKCSLTGNRTRAAGVRIRNPNP